MASYTARTGNPEAILDVETRLPEIPSPKTMTTGNARRRTVRVVLVGGAAAALSLAGAYQLRGAEALPGALIGVAAGGLIAALGVILRERARKLQGPRVVTAVMLSTLSCFLAFCALAAVAAIFFKPWAEPILLCALVVYLATLYMSSFWEKS